MPTTEVWYEIETSRKGEGDWFKVDARTYDDLGAARAALTRRIRLVRGDDEYDYRVVKTTVTTEVV